MLLTQIKRRVGIVQAVLRFSLALKGKCLVSPEGGKKNNKKKIFFWKYVSCGGETVVCVRCFFFFSSLLSFLGCCSLDSYWKHAFVSGKTDKCLAAFYWSSSYTRSQRLKEQTVNYRLCRSGVVLSCWHDISTHSAFIFADYDNTLHCYHF